MRAIACLLFAFAALGLCSEARAQAGVSAVPEFIPLTEQDLKSPAGAELASAQDAFRASLVEDPARALEIAKDIVRLTREAYGEPHEYVSRALTNLAIVQAEDAEFGAAIENYSAAIDVRERASGTAVSGDLINPLRGLADAYMALDDVARAIPVFERAIHISHVNAGPNNLGQVEIIDALSRAYYFSGDFEAADDIQDAVFRLRERSAEDNPDLYIDALEQRAAWYGWTADFEQAARFYRRLVRAISDRYGKDDIRLIEPLARFAHAADHDRGGRFIEGKRAIRKAVRIARKHADEDPTLLARTLVDQGDYFRALGNRRGSRHSYREAWDLLDNDPALHDTRDELFAEPVRVWVPQMRPIYGIPENKEANPVLYPQRGYVDVAFDVDARGIPVNTRVFDADPAGLMDVHVEHQVGRFRFRPAFRDGEPRASTGLSYRHIFRYDASALSDRERAIIESTVYDAEADSASTAKDEDDQRR